MLDFSDEPFEEKLPWTLRYDAFRFDIISNIICAQLLVFLCQVYEKLLSQIQGLNHSSYKLNVCQR